MGCYVYIAGLLIISQLLFSTLTLKNYFFALTKYDKKHKRYAPRVALIIPCKNLDENFEQNIASFYRQDYENYLLWFVVEDKADPAYEQLRGLKDKLAWSTKADDVQVLIAGVGQECSQKIHNLLYAYRRIPKDIETLAFADSDICVKPTWLHHLVYPLRHPESKGGGNRLSVVRSQDRQPCYACLISRKRQDCPAYGQHAFQSRLGRVNGDSCADLQGIGH